MHTPDYWGRPCQGNPADPYRTWDVEMSNTVSPIPAPKRPAPRIPRVVCKPERQANPYITRAICGLLWLLVCMGAVSLAAIATMPLGAQ
jgi:hypothetical protein